LVGHFNLKFPRLAYHKPDWHGTIHTIPYWNSASMTHAANNSPPAGQQPAASPKVLVVSGTVPGDDGVGAILLKSICERVPRHQLTSYMLIPRTADPHAHSEWIDEFAFRRYEHGLRPIGGLLGDCVSHAANLVLFRKHMRSIVRQGVRLGRASACNLVLAVMESPSAIFAAHPIAAGLGVPLVPFVMDAPELTAQQWGLDRWSRAALLRAFEVALHNARRIGVAGESMQTAYERRFQRPAVILRQGTNHTALPSKTPTPPTGGTLRIGFAGSVTAKDAFAGLVEGLDAQHWKIAGMDVTLRIIGGRYVCNSSGPQRIEYLGWQAVSDTIRLLSECDLLYLPQPFSTQLREFAELSFPNKMCTYASTQRPILLHAPPYASLVEFYREFPCGPVCNTLEPDEVMQGLTRLVSDPAYYAECIEHGRRSLSHRLSTAALDSNVAALLAQEP